MKILFKNHLFHIKNKKDIPNDIIEIVSLSDYNETIFYIETSDNHYISLKRGNYIGVIENIKRHPIEFYLIIILVIITLIFISTL